MDPDYAPIIARVRFKLGDYGKEDSKDLPYVVLSDKGTPNYINKFIPNLHIPKWFIPDGHDQFLIDFLKEIENVPVPRKGG